MLCYNLLKVFLCKILLSFININGDKESLDSEIVVQTYKYSINRIIYDSFDSSFSSKLNNIH